MIKELKVGDYIERFELGTEQKYNDVAGVIESFGFNNNSLSGYKGLLRREFNLLIIRSGGYSNADICSDCIRKLTYDQIMSLKKHQTKDAKVSIVNRDIEQAPKQSVSVDYLKRCIDVQAERGKQYDASGTGERSFDAAARAFNALTCEKLSGSDVCLLLTCVKVVRQNSNKSRLHDDSLLDGISYLSLWADELTKELS